MADDNLKNIENSIKEVGKNVNSAKSDVQDSIDKVESALKKVKNYASDIDNNTKGVKSIKEGVEKVVSKLDALNTIQSWVKNSDNYKDSGRGVRGSIEDKVKNILRRQEEISDEIGKIAIHTKEINWNTRDAADYLKLIKEHIVDGSTTASPAAVSSVTGGTSEIHSTVKDILKEIKGIRLDLSSKTFNTNDSNLDDKLKEIARIEADERLERAQLNEYYRTGKIDGKELKGSEKREFERKQREKQKEEQKRRDRISGKRGGRASGAKMASELTSFVTEKPSASKLADKGIGAISNAAPLLGGILGLAKAMLELGSKQDRATSEFARAIGGNRQAKVNAGETVRGMVRNMPAGRGYTADAAYSAMTEIAEARGRTTERMTAGSLQSAIDLKRFGIGADAVNNFDTFGKSLEQTDRYFARLYGEVSKKGLSFRNVSKAVNDNLRMAQSHTFANGLRGLQQMAEKSTQLKYNMQQVFQFADKVSELEGAISTSANLSVLGGQFAQFSNPMQMLYEGLNDTEALNDRIVGMFGNKAFWNNQTGQMDMTALDREMVKQAAKAAGLDPNEMLNMSYNQGKMRHIARQIGPGVNKDTAEYIKNIAEINDKGQAYVSLNGEEKLVRNLTNEDKDLLEKESRAKDAKENAKLGDIYSETMSIGEKLDNLLSYLQEQLGRWVFGLFNRFAAKENNRMNLAQGEGSDELQRKRLQYYNMHSSEYSGFLGRRKRWARDTVAHMSESELDRELAKDSPEGKSSGGYPALRVPGTSGFISGPSHFNGGVRGSLRGHPWEYEGDEFTVNAASSRKYRGELMRINNGTFNPYSYANSLVKNDMANHYNSMNVAATQTRASQNTQNQPNSVNGTIKVDIPQTITINLAGQGMIGNYDISGIISKYIDQFMKEAIMRRDFAGFNKESFYNKTISSAG